MVRTLLIFVFVCFGKFAGAQLFFSDQGTPIIPAVPCDCNTWTTIVKKIDSTVKQLHSITFVKNGQTYKRTYYVTITDSSLYDICSKPAACNGARRERKVPGKRDWFIDEALCKFISFTLPCCSDKKIDVKSVASINTKGKCNVVFKPETLDIPGDPLAYWTEEVTATASDGTVLKASIVMVNNERKIVDAKVDPFLEKIKKLNELANTKFKPVIDKANNLLNKYLSIIGTWKSEVKLGFNFGGESYKICCPGADCVKNSYKVYGEGNASLTGTCGIPVAGIPVVGKYLGGVEVLVTLGVGIGLNVSAKTTCTSFEICASPEGKLTGGGGFNFTVAGFKAEGQVVVEGGGLSGEVCFLPDFEIKCVKLTTGKLKLTGSVGDKWGWINQNFEYVVWNGFTAPLYGCN